MPGKYLEEVGFGEVIGKQDDLDKARFPKARVLGGHKVGGGLRALAGKVPTGMERRQGHLLNVI